MWTGYNTEILDWNCLFPQNFQIRKLGKISVFYAVVTFIQKLK